MLVLSRKIDEQIDIETPDGIIQIRLCSAHPFRATIGISAPPGYRILRAELRKEATA